MQWLAFFYLRFVASRAEQPFWRNSSRDPRLYFE
jgi:hypothetical protein